MNVSSVSTASWSIDQTSSSASGSSSFKSKMEEGKKLWESLQSSIESGDLEAAKSALDEIKKNMPAPPEGASAAGKSGKGNGGPAQDLEDLQKALESGDVSAAKSVMDLIETRRSEHEGRQQQSSSFDPSFNNDTSGMVGTLMNLVA